MFSKKGRGLTTLILCAMAVAFTGCSILMPYETSFQCPNVDKGECLPVKDAYDKSLNGARKSKAKDAKNCNVMEDGSKAYIFKKDGAMLPYCGPADDKTTVNIYKENLQAELSNLIKAPVTPVINPPKVMRVLVFPYPDGDTLYMPRYFYTIMDKPSWVIGNYLIGEKEMMK